MKSKIAELLKCDRIPVAVFRTDQKPENALMFKAGTKGCIMAFLNAASKGKTAALSENTVGCPGENLDLVFSLLNRGWLKNFYLQE